MVSVAHDGSVLGGTGLSVQLNTVTTGSLYCVTLTTIKKKIFKNLKLKEMIEDYALRPQTTPRQSLQA